MIRMDELSQLKNPTDLDLLELCILKNQSDNALKIIEKIRSGIEVTDSMIEVASIAYASKRHPARWDGEPWGEAGQINHKLAITAAITAALQAQKGNK